MPTKKQGKHAGTGIDRHTQWQAEASKLPLGKLACTVGDAVSSHNCSKE
jgi:hypothetical protein